MVHDIIDESFVVIEEGETIGGTQSLQRWGPTPKYLCLKK
jgi:hypothetical protein